MDAKILEKIQTMVESDEEQQDLFHAYDDMDKLRWAPPDGWTKRPELRVRISTAAHDALKQTANIFDTHNPKWEVLPLGEADYDRAEELETWIEYFTQKANSIGETSPFRKGLFNSAKFNRVIYHVDYLPYWLPKDKESWTLEQKANAVNGPFCITALDPRNFRFKIGKYGLREIVSISNVEGQAIIDQWAVYESDTGEGLQIKRGLAKIKAIIDKEDECTFIYVDYVTHDKRCVAAFKTKSSGIDDIDNANESEAIDILNGENKLKFIPYAVATGDSDALLYSMWIGGSWENQNVIDSIMDTSVLRRAYFPPIIHTSTTGKELDINYDGSQDVMELGIGETAQVTNPPPIDPGIAQLANINQQRMGEAAGIRNLGLQDIAGNVQFSTVQAQIQLQMTALQPYKRTDEKAKAQIPLLMFKWLKVSESREVALRPANRVKKEGQFAGDPISLGIDDFDPDVMQITCELLANTPTDKQQLVNMYATLKQAGAQVAWGELLERLQLGNPEMLKAGWLDEQMEGAALQNFVAEMQAKLQLKIEAEKLKMQIDAQKAMQPQPPTDTQGEPMPPEQSGAMANAPVQGNAVIPRGQENNPAAGGQPEMMATPGMTRNNVGQPA